MVNGQRKPAKAKAQKDNKSDTSNGFLLGLWTLMTVQNWILDFGRPIAMLAFPLNWFPLSMPSVGDYFHMAYNVITPFCLLRLLDLCRYRISPSLRYLTVVFMVMGASIHLVGDSINHRLVFSGYQYHLSVRENPVMQQLQPQSLVDSFELLYYYDEHLGHLMWYIPFFLALVFFLWGSFLPEGESPEKVYLPVSGQFLLLPSAVYYWYLVTEGQIFSAFFSAYVAMMAIVAVRLHQRLVLDNNGRFLLYSFTMTLLLVSAWVVWLWDNDAMRQKYPGWLYIPEPWSWLSTVRKLG